MKFHIKILIDFTADYAVHLLLIVEVQKVTHSCVTTQRLFIAYTALKIINCSVFVAQALTILYFHFRLRNYIVNVKLSIYDLKGLYFTNKKYKSN